MYASDTPFGNCVLRCSIHTHPYVGSGLYV
jgi:hypothetical protein